MHDINIVKWLSILCRRFAILLYQLYKTGNSLSTWLVALCHMHRHYTYKWECCNDPNEKFSSTPVVYVRNPLVYMCSVTFSGRYTVLGSVNFDISFDPDIGNNYYASIEFYTIQFFAQVHTSMWQTHYHKYLRFELLPQTAVVTVLLLNHHLDMN